MAVISQEEVDAILGAHKFGIRKSLMDAWGDYRNPENYSHEVRAIHDNTTRANCVHSHIRKRISDYASRHPDKFETRISERMFTLIAKGDADVSVGIRFKKLDNELRTANVSTEQVKAFKQQEEIPSLGAKHHLEFGYRLDDSEQNILGIFLICPSGEHSNAWADEITDIKVVSVVADFFPRGAQDVEEDDSSNVRPRRSADVVPLKRDTKDDKENQ